MIRIKATIDLSDMKRKYELAFAKGGMIQSFVDETVLSGVTPYVPIDKGDLSRSAKENTTIGSGMITWSAPHARYVWHGKSKSGKDLNYTLTKHPLAGKMWTERYKADHMAELKQMVIRKVKSI